MDNAAKTTTVTLTNRFHNTSTTVRLPAYEADGQSPQQVYGWLLQFYPARARRIRRTLCGSPNCTCGVVRP